MEENVVVEELQEQKKPTAFVTIKNIVRMLSLLCLICVFCPAFLVSCSGQTAEIDAMTIVQGVEQYGQTIVEPQLWLLIVFLIPVACLVLLFTKFLANDMAAGVIAACGAVDLLVWNYFKDGVEKFATQNSCTFETTGWFTLNMLSLVVMIALGALVFFTKLGFEDDLLTTFPEIKEFFTNPEGPVQKLIAKVLALPKKVLLAGAGGIAVVILVVCLILGMGATINLDKYVIITTNGYNGYGTAQIEIDWQSVQADYGEKIKFTKEAQQQYGESLLGMSPLTVLKNSVSVKIEEPYNLSNDGEVKYTWTVVEEGLKLIDCTLKYEDGTHKVTGLQEIEKFDPFIGVEVTFSGIAPNGQASFERADTENGLTYQFDKNHGLKNGDVVTLTVGFGWNGSESDYASSYGKLPLTTTKEYTVSGLDEYVASFKGMNDTFVNTLKKEAEDSIYAYTARYYGTNIKMEKLTYAGYILNARTSGSASTNNELYIIYSAMLSSPEGKFEATKVYYPVHFVNIKKSNGEFSYGQNYGIQGSCYLGNYYSSTYGYNNPVKLYADVAWTGENRTVEAGDGFEKYGSYEMVKSLTDMTDEYKKSLSADAKATIEKYIQTDYSEETVVTNLAEVGFYFLSAKEQGTNLAYNNICYVVYSATLSHKENKFESTTVYYPVKYDGLVKLKSNEYIITEKDGIQGSVRLNDDWWYSYSTKGYKDGSQMFTDLITSNRDRYTYELSEALKQFGE